MRVMLAGTAATAANMYSMPNYAANTAQQASRGGSAERGWMEVQFLWKPVPLPALLGPGVFTEHQERPYLLSLLEDMPQNPPRGQVDILTTLAQTIAAHKRFTDRGKLTWLTGCWLALEKSKPPPPSVLAIDAAELVRGHFLEPALAVSVADKKPYMGNGTEHRKRVMGPLRMALRLYRNRNIEIIWWALLTCDYNEGYSAGSMGMERALTTHCIQTCLATEPVLAVCLSIKHKFPSHEFGKAFSELWKESVGNMDGELNEYLMFAALQMACRSGDGGSFPHTRSVAKTVERMREYLSQSQPDPPPSDFVRDVRDSASRFKVGEFELDQFENDDIEYSYGRGGKDDENSIHGLHKDTKMPWLVPACSHAALEKTIKLTQSGEKPLFATMGIAGLVPDTTNSCLDASAYLWESKDNSDCVAPLEWTFQLNGRSRSYSLEQACTDLENKCTRFTDEHKKKVKFHSMLVGLTGGGSIESECRIWAQDGKLRIVLLVGSLLV